MDFWITTPEIRPETWEPGTVLEFVAEYNYRQVWTILALDGDNITVSNRDNCRNHTDEPAMEITSTLDSFVEYMRFMVST
jgi:hypothetical protein